MPEPINLQIFHDVFLHMEGRVKYGWGIKASSLECDSHDIVALDCSGWSRYVIARATEQKWLLPDGSVNQHEACDQAGLVKVEYHLGNGDGKLYICFMAPAGKRAGHVFFEKDSFTYECCGSLGVGSRSWLTPVLAQNCCAAYELPTVG